MRLLLDENVPRKLKFRLTRFGAATVQEMGWSGITNGELLARMTEAGFDVLLTFDKGLSYQQNFVRYPIPVIVIRAHTNTYDAILPLLPAIIDLLESGAMAAGVNLLD
jgi:predicted nuclease of predicted toxin-antitoxin system